MAAKPIRVLIVESTRVLRESLSRTLSSDLFVEVVDAISSPAQAMQAIRRHSPNIVLLDISGKPGGDRKELVGRIREDFPGLPVIVTNSLNSNVFEALKMGAVDFVAKDASRDCTAFASDVLKKIKTVYSSSAGQRVSASLAQKPPSSPVQRAAPSVDAPRKPPVSPAAFFPKASKRIIAIGASTGGTEAILSVVRGLPANTPGVVIVQHMPPVFTAMYADRMDKACSMSAREARNGDRVEPGVILLAEGSQHMRVLKDANGYYVRLEKGEKVSGHCPSVDVLFESVAHTAGENAVGVILTGMGGDGAKNLLRMREAGAYTIGQDEASCVVYGMPMVAYNLGAVVDQLPLEKISAAIVRHLSK